MYLVPLSWEQLIPGMTNLHQHCKRCFCWKIGSHKIVLLVSTCPLAMQVEKFLGQVLQYKSVQLILLYHNLCLCNSTIFISQLFPAGSKDSLTLVIAGWPRCFSQQQIKSNNSQSMALHCRCLPFHYRSAKSLKPPLFPAFKQASPF